MSRKRTHRRTFQGSSGPALSIPRGLLDALAAVHGPLDPRRLAPAVARLNEGLTGRREAAGVDYLRDPGLRAAYGTYYLCANAPKAWPLLDRLALPPGGSVLELGCGPGTGVAALLGRGLRHLATDRQPANLEATRRLAAALGAPVDTAVADLGRPLVPQIGAGRFDLVLLMNVVNELPEAGDGRLADDLAALAAPAGVVLVIEPAALEPSRRALALRDRMVAAGWRVLLPCTHARACPALADPAGWCHGTWRFDRPDFMAEIDARVGTRREVLKATYFALTRAPGPTDDRRLCAVSERFDEKGRVRVRVCGAAGLDTLEVQRRDLGPETADLATVERHDVLLVEGAERVGGALRIPRGGACRRV